MSIHQAFRRAAVPGQLAEKQATHTFPAPLKGIMTSENQAFMTPGTALVLDNWKPTMRGVALRGGCIRHCVLPETTPVISGFEYASGNNIRKMFAANSSGKLYDVTSNTPVEIVSGAGSGNWSASQLANAAGEWLIAVNDWGDIPLRFDGTTWTDATDIVGPVGSRVEDGSNLVHVWKYRNRLFFIEQNSMNAWYLGIDAIAGTLQQIPLSGAATQGGKLLGGAVWSLDAGDGTDDKCIFFTDLGEVLVFTGSNPGEAANWRQEGRFQLDKPLGKNATVQVGGDLLIATIDGLTPISAAVSKVGEELDLAKVTWPIRSMWRDMAISKNNWAWTMKRWDEYGGMFVTWPGGSPGQQMCAVVNTGAGSRAWCRFIGYDATCFMKMRGQMFFGTQKGIIMEADRGGYDDGKPYLATAVGAWGTLGSQPAQATWTQARASFLAAQGEPFQPQLGAVVDFMMNLPQPPQAGFDAGPQDTWDEGLWDSAQWDQPAVARAPTIRNTGWVSIGRTGYTHAPVIQVLVAQQGKPNVEMIAIDAAYKRLAVTV